MLNVKAGVSWTCLLKALMDMWDIEEHPPPHKPRQENESRERQRRKSLVESTVKMSKVWENHLVWMYQHSPVCLSLNNEWIFFFFWVYEWLPLFDFTLQQGHLIIGRDIFNDPFLTVGVVQSPQHPFIYQGYSLSSALHLVVFSTITIIHNALRLSLSPWYAFIIIINSLSFNT